MTRFIKLFVCDAVLMLSLTACAPHIASSDQLVSKQVQQHEVVTLKRAVYFSKAACEAEWGQDCNDPSNPATNVHRGPFFTESGTVYHVQGGTSPMQPGQVVSGNVENIDVPVTSLSGLYQTASNASVTHASPQNAGESITKASDNSGSSVASVVRHLGGIILAILL